MNLLVILYIVNFLRTILIIVVIYYGIRLFSKYILPLLVDKGLKNMQQKMQNQQRQNQRTTRPDGEVTIEDTKKSYKSESQNQGDYVDFEEVD
jgi:uncharacterized membrane protein (DUF106 family)